MESTKSTHSNPNLPPPPLLTFDLCLSGFWRPCRRDVSPSFWAMAGNCRLGRWLIGGRLPSGQMKGSSSRYNLNEAWKKLQLSPTHNFWILLMIGHWPCSVGCWHIFISCGEGVGLARMSFRLYPLDNLSYVVTCMQNSTVYGRSVCFNLMKRRYCQDFTP